ncbi:hypothetical protein CXB49_02015 [Chromobacterium sp. ATCC 53434]|uniref:DUF3761 domain-containing protein n=1 Tax=Chromobacterium TaxID=535 RepID=UPI000C788945|nr:DUF3761 domain-containing protein [Chromobacterium sp. ATCC 53434]AUH49692.1 hypothetical protein CXB49_02015 [Chromobacterium sp. ATCC 53434]
MRAIAMMAGAAAALLLALSAPPAQAQRVTGSTNLVTGDGAAGHGDRTVRARSKPAGATARCRDGSYSHSRRGACVGHRGVAKRYR